MCLRLACRLKVIAWWRKKTFLAPPTRLKNEYTINQMTPLKKGAAPSSKMCTIGSRVFSEFFVHISRMEQPLYSDPCGID